MALSILVLFYDPSQLFTQLTEISPFSPFARLNLQASSENKPIKQTEKTNEHKQTHQSTLCTII
jgi:hypothetical protein